MNNSNILFVRLLVLKTAVVVSSLRKHRKTATTNKVLKSPKIDERTPNTKDMISMDDMSMEARYTSWLLLQSYGIKPKFSLEMTEKL